MTHATPSFVNIGVTVIVTSLGSESGLDAVNVISASELVISRVSSGNPIISPVADQSYVVTPKVLLVVKSIVASLHYKQLYQLLHSSVP